MVKKSFRDCKHFWNDKKIPLYVLGKIFIENPFSLGIDLNSKDIDGKTAFHWACQFGHTGVINNFMENAANLSIDLNSKDKSGNTGFQWACQMRKTDVVNILKKNASNLF